MALYYCCCIYGFNGALQFQAINVLGFVPCKAHWSFGWGFGNGIWGISCLCLCLSKAVLANMLTHLDLYFSALRVIPVLHPLKFPH